MIDIRPLAARGAARQGEVRAAPRFHQNSAMKLPRKPPMCGGAEESSIMSQATVKEQVFAFLFDQEGVKLRNIKLFVGDKDNVTEDDILAEMHQAFIQERMGTAKVSTVFEDDRPTVDVEKFLSQL
jgi:hypothetical protein